MPSLGVRSPCNIVCLAFRVNIIRDDHLLRARVNSILEFTEISTRLSSNDYKKKQALRRQLVTYSKEGSRMELLMSSLMILNLLT